MWLIDPAKLSNSVLISNMIHAIDGIQRKKFMEEFDRRFPYPSEQKKPETPETSDFDKDGWPTTSGYYFVQFLGPLEIVWYNEETKLVQRIGLLGTWSTIEFRWHQKIKDPKIPAFKSSEQSLETVQEDKKSEEISQNLEQPKLIICEDFNRIWNNLSRVISNMKEGNLTFVDISILEGIHNMFQNPATIVHKEQQT